VTSLLRKKELYAQPHPGKRKKEGGNKPRRYPLLPHRKREGKKREPVTSSRRRTRRGGKRRGGKSHMIGQVPHCLLVLTQGEEKRERADNHDKKETTHHATAEKRREPETSSWIPCVSRRKKGKTLWYVPAPSSACLHPEKKEKKEGGSPDP